MPYRVGYTDAIDQPLSPVVPSAPDSHPQNQRKEVPWRDQPLEPQRPVEPAALQPVESANVSTHAMATGAAAPFRTESPSAAPESHAAPRVVEPPPIEPRPSQPVRDVTLHLTSDSQSVDVKLVDRGGELHVAVHSADPVLTTDLRSRVHDLIGGLEKSGFRAETWQPADVHHSSEAGVHTSPASGDAPQYAGDDAQQRGRNPYDPDYAPSKRDSSSRYGSNIEWINQISALTGAEREN